MLISTASSSASTENMTGLVFPPDYNKNVAPVGKNVIRVGFEIEDISEVSDKDFCITVILRTMLNWNDSRLQVNRRVFEQLSLEDRLNIATCQRNWKKLLCFLPLQMVLSSSL